MKKLNLVIPAAIFAAAAFLTIPRDSKGYVLLNIALDPAEIGFQVYQTSFTDSASNNNNAADANFPGATGAALACWKAAAEWNSELRGGNGNGDSSQPGGLGSGNSNFDWMYQGVATNSGGGTSNVINCGGFLGAGVFAATGPTSSGWTMVFDNSPNNGWNWVDGPGNETGGSSTDIQGIAVHEIGHALGMGHSADSNATMYAGTWPSQSYYLRSINSDDSAGIIAKYQAKSSGKPVISALTGNIYIGGVITLTGANFSNTGNEVWFTKNYGGATSGTPPLPVKVTNIASSSGGTIINVTVPSGVSKGEVIVKQSGTLSQGIKSAPFPFDLQSGPTTPILSSLAPNPIASAALPTPILTISGNNFSSATSVKIGTQTYSSGQFTIVNNSTLQVSFNPPPNEVGNVNVTVTNSTGTSPASPLTINLPAANVLFASKTNPSAGTNVTLYYATPAPGDLPLASYSSCITPLPAPPYFTLSIGGCGDLQFLPNYPPTGANGISSDVAPIPATFHGIVFLQFIRYNPSLPLPWPVSNVAILNVP